MVLLKNNGGLLPQAGVLGLAFPACTVVVITTLVLTLTYAVTPYATVANVTVAAAAATTTVLPLLPAAPPPPTTPRGRLLPEPQLVLVSMMLIATYICARTVSCSAEAIDAIECLCRCPTAGSYIPGHQTHP